mgnify:CR=1 FL=1
MRKLIRYFIYTLLLLSAMLLLFLLVMTLLDYKPDTKKLLFVNENSKPIGQQDTITVMSWNIGYAGLSVDMDFFYEGGKQVRTSKEQAEINLREIAGFLERNDSVDIILIQEIDRKARRSYNINQLNYISAILPEHFFYFAKDYDVFFVPLPISNPMGGAVSGIASLSRFLPSECVQYAYPSQGKWPVSLFQVDNCFIICRYPLSNGKDLIVINTHNSAYDDGDKRMVEMDYLRRILLVEYNKGNYVVAGGDWNQIPPLATSLFQFDKNINRDYRQYFNPLPIDTGFMPDCWQWISDGKVTNRFLYEPYKREQTAETLIDFFLVSPNLSVIDFKTIDLKFKNSDHNPVLIRFVFNTY